MDALVVVGVIDRTTPNMVKFHALDRDVGVIANVYVDKSRFPEGLAPRSIKISIEMADPPGNRLEKAGSSGTVHLPAKLVKRKDSHERAVERWDKTKATRRKDGE